MAADPKGTPALTANQLRALAEAADGLRNEDAIVIRRRDGGEGYEVVSRREHPDAEAVLELRTDDVPPFAPRKRLELAAGRRVRLRDRKELTLADADAIFTTLAAFEKFAVPYYARLRGLDEVERLRVRFATDATILALVHLPDSMIGEVEEDDGS